MENRLEKTSDYWIGIAQILQRNLEEANPQDPEGQNAYEHSLKEYEHAIDEIKARKDQYSGSPMVEAQAEELIKESEAKLKLFRDKLEQA